MGQQGWHGSTTTSFRSLNNIFLKDKIKQDTSVSQKCVFPYSGRCSSSAIIQGSLLLVAVHILANCFYFGTDTIV